MGDLSERFWAKVEIIPFHGCWEWTASQNRLGYGLIHEKRRMLKAHRVSWELHYGKVIPAGLFVCHHCDNPGCVNPSHLFLGTNTDNLRDMSAKGRSRGQKVTHCPNGHEYSEENTYRYPNGRRDCRECHRASGKAYKLREKRKRALGVG